MISEQSARLAIITAARSLAGLNLNQGASGNISLRWQDGLLITPSAIAYDDMQPAQIAHMTLTGERGAFTGPARPSSEWRFHYDIMHSRPDIGAIVHTHAPFATALAIAGKSIPPCHYMIVRFGGDDVRCAPYATFGSQDLSEQALLALHGRSACLLANHGMIATGANLTQAMQCAVELETLAGQYFRSLLIGGSVLLTKAQIDEAVSQFATGYGSQPREISISSHPVTI
ncbi:MAG TPA: class II aldolase/adducin family protein [Acetobacteraceae bacterium]|nr:class II aldolase/adducin family protein [Acetobacteraceae bacterium]